MIRRISEKAKLTGSPLHFVSTFRIGFQTISINPCQRCRHHTEVQVIGHRLRISALAFLATYVLLELFESGFDLPSCPVILDNLCD